MTTNALKSRARAMFDGARPKPLRPTDVAHERTCEDPTPEEARALAFAVQASGVGHWRHDIVTGHLELSSGCKTILGLEPDASVRFAQLLEMIHPDDRERAQSVIRDALERPEMDDFLFEHRTVARNGEVRWVATRGRICRARPERPVIAGILVDTTQQKQLEAERERLIGELAAERARLRALVEHLPAAVLVGDATGRVVLANPAVQKVFPLPHPPVPVDVGVLYRSWFARHADGRPVEAHERPLSRALLGETVPAEDFRYLREDGTDAWLRLSSAPILGEDGEIAGGVVVGSDITERMQAEAERESLLRSLEQSEERYRLAALAADDAIYDWDIRGDRVAVQRLFSHPQDSILRAESWSELIHPDDRERVVAGLTAALERGDHHWQDEYRFVDADGRWLIVTDRGYIVYADSGEPIRMVGAMQDVTARRRQQEFERQLIGIVSHDLKNPLNTILLAAGMVARSEEIGERAVRNTVRIQGAAQRASRMIRDLLDFTRARLSGGIPIERRSADLGSLFRELIEDIRVGHPGRSVLFEASGDLTGDFDPDRLAQVLTNLTENAIKYSPDSSPVRVVLEGSGEGVLLRVHNDGPPIPSELVPKIFEPLSRGESAFDPDGRSVGLGLYIVKHLVTAHGGAVDVRSTQADGTEFVVRLPRCVEPLAPSGAVAAP